MVRRTTFFTAAVAVVLASQAAFCLTPEQAALDALTEQARQTDAKSATDWKTSDVADARVRDVVTTRHNNMRHVWMQQYIDDLPVAFGIANANVAADERVVSLHNRMSANAGARTNARQPKRSAADALVAYARARDLKARGAPRRLDGGTSESMRFAGGGLAKREIPVNLAWLDYNGRLRLVWEMAVDEKDSADWIHAFVDADTGELLRTVNWTHHAGYNVFPEPLENPARGPRQQVVDPHDPDASPQGWHDDSTNTYTDTRGNNVLAQDDVDGNDAGGSRPDGGTGLVFDFALDLDTQQPGEYLPFAITNLFYWNNRLHDVLWHYGFDEPAGNFQTDNFGRGGSDGDAVRADAQDGSGTNNAQFSTPPDGLPGRMQMYVFTGTNPTTLRVDEPAASAGDYTAEQANFGATPVATPDSIGLERVDDGSADPELGCGPLEGFTAGNIALVRRGDCEFGTKSLNAEQAGAVAVVVINNIGGNATLEMDGGVDGGAVTIPAVMIGDSDGDAIVADLVNNITGSLFKPDGADLDRDSDLDAGVMAHEYGHGLSVRLTGGPSSSSCLSGAQQAGEGWSDFVGLWMTARPGDTAEQLRGTGSYVSFREDVPGATIRPFPYTRDMSANPLVYEDIDSVSVPHGVGTVFASALWDVYWNLVDKLGFDPDRIDGTGGNQLTMQLVVDGLKMQPCDPTFLDARDAIVQADVINNDGANQCAIWRGFARRGMGVNADDGGNAGSLAVTNGFELPEGCGEALFVDGFES